VQVEVAGSKVHMIYGSLMVPWGCHVLLTYTPLMASSLLTGVDAEKQAKRSCGDVEVDDQVRRAQECSLNKLRLKP
jgi:hypothetical protein